MKLLAILLITGISACADSEAQSDSVETIPVSYDFKCVPVQCSLGSLSPLIRCENGEVICYRGIHDFSCVKK